MTNGPSASRSAEWTGLPVSASCSVNSGACAPGAQDAVFDAGGEELGGLLLRDGQPLGLNQGAGVLRDAVEFVLQRGQRGAGHGLHTFIIAAMSIVSRAVRHWTLSHRDSRLRRQVSQRS